MPEHHKVFVSVSLILKKDDRVFLLRRANTGYEDGNYSLPSGHLERGEQPSDAAIREAKEESGIDASPEDADCVHVVHRADDGRGGREYDDFFFVCDTWKGEPHNAEPGQCDDCGWFSLDQLPSNMIPWVKAALEHIQKNQFYSEQ
jgi:8-oxo-dGTP pyrophosphatase MutT (NUDIX family)